MHKKIYILVLMIICILCVNKVYAYEAYKVGDQVIYNGEDYYVIEDSGADKNYVTLLKEKPLTAEEVNKYNGGEYESKNGEMPYNLSCDSIEALTGQCRGNNYDDSPIKVLVDNWSSNLKGLIEVGGYKARLITIDEILNNMSIDTCYSSNIGYKVTDTWMYNINYSYWTMSHDRVSAFHAYCVGESGILYSKSAGENLFVRPVINLNKNALDCKYGYTYKTEKVKRYNEFKIGDEITYKGEKYYVIKNSDLSSKSLTLLKAEPLTIDEINKYKGNLDFTSENNGMPYYKSGDCYYNSEDDHNTTGCTNSYNRSYVKQVIDKWSSRFDDLVEIDGYKARLLNEGDLYSLGYERKIVGTSDGFCKTEYTPEWVFDNIYWTMFGVDDGSSIYEVTEKECLYMGSNDQRYQDFYKKSLNTYESSAVRPVINIDKCAVDDGCYEEVVEVAVGCKDTNTSNNVVNVPNTLKKVSITIFVICGILLVSGIGIIIFNYIKSRKERK